MTEEAVLAFLRDYTELTKRHGLCLCSCSCCGGLNLSACDADGDDPTVEVMSNDGAFCLIRGVESIYDENTKDEYWAWQERWNPL